MNQELPHKFDTKSLFFVENSIGTMGEMLNAVSAFTSVINPKDGWYKASVEFQLEDGEIRTVQNFMVLTDSYVPPKLFETDPGPQPKPEPKESVHMDDQGWWYWKKGLEGEDYRAGPYQSKVQAEDAYTYYCRLPESDSEPKPKSKEGVYKEGDSWWYRFKAFGRLAYRAGPYPNQAHAEDAYNHYCATLLVQGMSERQPKPTGVTKMSEHKYADIFKALGENKTIEGRYQGDAWVEILEPWKVFGNPKWELRVRVPMVLINGIAVPEPVQEPLKRGQTYYFVSLASTELAVEEVWTDDDLDNLRLERVLIQLTKEGAIAQAEAMLSFCGATGE